MQEPSWPSGKAVILEQITQDNFPTLTENRNIKIRSNAFVSMHLKNKTVTTRSTGRKEQGDGEDTKKARNDATVMPLACLQPSIFSSKSVERR